MDVENRDERRWSSSGENSRDRVSAGVGSAGTSPQRSPWSETRNVELGGSSGDREQDPPAQGPRRSDGWRDHGSTIND
jgi:hypothetical protein